MTEAWLNGWHRTGSIVIVGVGVRCAGCGKEQGITCVALSDVDYPSELPSWPFDVDTCPVCDMRTRTYDPQDARDKLTERLIALKASK